MHARLVVAHQVERHVGGEAVEGASGRRRARGGWRRRTGAGARRGGGTTSSSSRSGCPASSGAIASSTTQPIRACGRWRRSAVEHRQGVHDVAQGAGADDEDRLTSAVRRLPAAP